MAARVNRRSGVNSIRVFIVDDHPLVREWLGNLLRMEKDIEVVGEAEDGMSALSAIQRLQPDVAVVDLSLKRGSGLDLIKDVQARQGRTRTLVLSMHEEIRDVERALRAGARGYVMKRESTSQIVQAIRQVHAGKVFAAPDVLSKLAERMVGREPVAESEVAESLSDREIEVFRRLGAGHSTKRIAEELGVSQKTVQTYCGRIKEKMGLADNNELLQAAIRLGEKQRHSSL
jgi:DNA-binding NarL/FixJ family response regulator